MKIRSKSSRGKYNNTDPGSDSGAKQEVLIASSSYAVIFSDTRVRRRPCARFIHSFFKSNAIASRNSSARILAFPLVRNLRNPKSFFSNPKAPSTWIERHTRRCMPRGEVIRCSASPLFSQKVFCICSSLSYSWSLARQHCSRHGQPIQLSHRYPALSMNCPSFTSLLPSPASSLPASSTHTYTVPLDSLSSSRL